MAVFKDEAGEGKGKRCLLCWRVSHSDGKDNTPMDDPVTHDFRQTRGRH